MKTAQDFNNLKIGDIIKLSDLQTQEDFGEFPVVFKVEDVRVYEYPEINLKATCYIIKNPKQKQDLMIMVKQIGDVFELFSYYMDNQGNINGTPIIEGEELSKTFQVFVNNGTDESCINWWLQGGNLFGVQLGEEIKTLGYYFTNDEVFGGVNPNPYCFVEWTGNTETGFFEMWYGSLLKLEEVEFMKVIK